MGETYIFEGGEVKLTGREATKELKLPNGTVTRTLKLVEITPVDDTFSWKKWTDPSVLYIVK